MLKELLHTLIGNEKQPKKKKIIEKKPKEDHCCEKHEVEDKKKNIFRVKVENSDSESEAEDSVDY